MNLEPNEVLDWDAIKKTSAFKDWNAMYMFGPATILGIIQSYKNASAVEISLKIAFNDLITMMDKDPYVLIQATSTTFKRLDDALMRLDKKDRWYVEPFSVQRLNALFVDNFEEINNSGLDMLSEDQYHELQKKNYMQIVSATPDALLTSQLKQDFVEALKNNPEIIEVKYHNEPVYMLREVYDRNLKLADQFTDLVKTPKKTHAVNDSLFELSVTNPDNAFQNDDGSIEYMSEDRQEIVKALITEPVSLLTGYAGTGKTSLLRILIDYLAFNKNKVTMCATAGKAAHNLYQSTYGKASTIAKLVTQDIPLQSEYVIVDEISMVSEKSMHNLLKLVPKSAHLIMLGDIAQLPSVGGVGMLTSLLPFVQSHNSISTFNLTKQHRTDGALTKASNQIRNGIVPTDFNVNDGTLTYRHVSNLDIVAELYYKTALAKGIDDTAVIGSTNASVDQLNATIQKAFMRNQHKQAKDFLNDAHPLFVGDKVLVTRNMYNKLIDQTSVQYDRSGNDFDKNDPTNRRDLFNGFTGTVVKIVNSKLYGRGVLVKFADMDLDVHAKTAEDMYFTFYSKPNVVKDANFPYAQLAFLTLGYALTIHKSQGSTIPYAMLYLGESNEQSTYFLQNKQLLYTAYTRGKHLAVLSAEPITKQLLAKFVNTDCYDHINSNLEYELEQRLD